LWLKYAKEKWLRNDVGAARKILASAFEANSDNEEIWLAAVKLENRAKEVERARLLLQRARDKASTERVWMKSALFEREHGGHISFHSRFTHFLSSLFAGDHEAERSLILKAVEMFPNFAKLHMMLVQVYVHFGDVETARQAYNKAVTLCPKSVQLWIVAAHMEQAVRVTQRSFFRCYQTCCCRLAPLRELDLFLSARAMPMTTIRFCGWKQFETKPTPGKNG